MSGWISSELPPAARGQADEIRGALHEELKKASKRPRQHGAALHAPRGIGQRARIGRDTEGGAQGGPASHRLAELPGQIEERVALGHSPMMKIGCLSGC